MFRKFKRIFSVNFGLALIVFTVYVMLDTFVIARPMETAAAAETAAEAKRETEMETAEAAEAVMAEADKTAEEAEKDASEAEDVPETEVTVSAETEAEAETEEASSDSADGSSRTAGIGTVMTDTSYSDENIDIELTTYREYDTQIYVAKVSADAAYLKTAFADDTYGKNVTAKASEIAEDAGAILAINGDYYGAQERGYVIREGVVYRDRAERGQEDLVIYQDGSFGFINEEDVTAQELVEAGAVQVLSFGPALIMDGEISVSEGEEVGKAMASNPRTAIARTYDGDYLFVVADGRTEESSGLSLSQLAGFLQSLGAEDAYNLDGGGSSTMVFNGEVVNNPTTGGRIKERSVSDIVYFGY